MTDQEMKDWIDSASYESLLTRWRFAKVGDKFFQGEVGEYYSNVMKRLRNEIPNEEHVATSKRIGWDK